MKISNLLQITSIFLFFNVANTQTIEKWAARYNGGGVDQLYDMTVDGSNNVYVTGASIQGGLTTDYLTIKYNSSGIEQWRKVFNGSSSSEDRAYLIDVDISGNVYITGGINYNNSIATIKYNSVGDTLWIRTYTGPTSGHNWTYPTSLVVDDSGYVYVAGTSEGSSSAHGFFQDFTTIKYSPSGEKLWVQRYNGLGNDDDVINSMEVDSLGNIYVTGYTDGGSSGSSDSYDDITTIKYNSLGTLLWNKTYKGFGTSTDIAKMISLDNLGNVYITGSTYTDAINKVDVIIIKYNNDGTELWKKTHNGLDNDTDEGKALIIDSKHNVYVTGTSDVGTLNGLDIVTIKFDSTGRELWTANFNGTSSLNDVAEEIKLDNLGNIYVLGTSKNTSTNEDFQIIKYDSLGILIWETKYTNFNSAGSEENASSLFVKNKENIYSSGTSALDFAVAKYSETLGLEEIQISNTIFPNPSNGKFTIRTENTEIETIEIYNHLGEKVFTKKDVKQQSSIEIDISNSPRGFYYVFQLAKNRKKIHKDKIEIY